MRYLVLTHSAAKAVVMTSVLAVFITAVAASAYRWRAKTAAITYRAGFAAGLSWSTICRFSAQLLEGLRRHGS
jgi:hypothetical protein